MSQPTTICPNCGAPYPADRPEGLCPNCIVRQLLSPMGSAVDDTGRRDSPFIDGYLVGERLGEGGMGTVYRARQIDPVERDVALKIVKPGYDTREVIARFRREQQSLAVMDHPDIARVFGAGHTDDGRPFFAMELVEGEPITRFCERLGFSLENRLALFERVCSAVQHAHGKGVIHRDLKPSNILVGGTAAEPTLKIIDFGIAKAACPEAASEDTLHTLQGQVFGTPGYMSPEQVSGSSDIDTRSDVYSLGAVLYELLAGSSPITAETLRAAGAAEVIRLVCEEGPPLPSCRRTQSGLGRMPKDLDWIAMKALSMERGRRYGTAAALGDDVRRFLADEPVMAGAPTLGYRVSKFVRKHRVGVASVAGLVLVLAAGLGFALSAAERERLAKLQAQEVLSDARRDAGLRASRDGEHALAALLFELAGGEANVARSALHRAAAVLPVRYIEAPFLSDISFLRFDDGGEYLIEAGNRGGAMLFDLERGELIGQWEAACFLPDGLFARGLSGGKGEIVELASGEVIEEFVWGGTKLLSISAGNGGQTLLIGSDGALEVWDRDGRQVATSLPHQSGVIYARRHAASGRVLIVDGEFRLCVFDGEESSGDVLFPPLHVPQNSYFRDGLAPVFAGDGGAEILAHTDRGCGYYSSDSGELLRLVGEGAGTVYQVAEGGNLATSLHRGRDIGMSHFIPGTTWRYLSQLGQIVDEDGEVRAAIPFPHRLPYRFSGDAALYASRMDDGLFVARLQWPGDLLHRQVEAPLAGRAVFSQSGRFFASAGGPTHGQHESRTRVFDADGDPAGPEFDTGAPLYGATFSAGGERLITVGAAGLSIWDWRSGERLREVAMPSEARAVSAHPAEEWVAVACAGGELLKVATASGEVTSLLRWEVSGLELGHGAPGPYLAFTEDGQRLYVAGIDRSCFGLDVERRELMFSPVSHRAAASHVLLDDGVLVAPGPSEMAEWFFDPNDGRPLTRARSPIDFYRPSGVTLSPHDDGELLLSTDRGVGVVDWRTGELWATFSPESSGRGMVSEYFAGEPWAITVERAADDRRFLHLWELETGEPMAPAAELPTSNLQWITRSPDGSRAVVTSFGRGYTVVEFGGLEDQALPPEGLDRGERLRLAAIDAGYRVVEGRPVRFARGDEWAKLFREFWEARAPRPLRRKKTNEP